MLKYAYDIECLKNLFTATFVNVDDESDKHVFYIGLGKEDYSEILQFLNNQMALVGYNCQSYDDPMLRFLIVYKGDKVNSELHKLSAKLVDDGYKQDKVILALRYPKTFTYPWHSIDLMRILAFDKLGISLKQVAINLKWHKIQDMPIDHNTSVHINELDMILDYNLNDVLITKRLYEEITPIRELRNQLSKIYSVDLTSASDSRVANIILESIYANEMKIDIRQLRDMRTSRDKVFLGECIAKFVKFKTPSLNEVLDRISSNYVNRFNNYRYSETVYFANCKFALGIGGLHTEDVPGIFITDDKYIIQDLDVASYYPNLIINNNFYPKHLGIGFIQVLKRITQERISAKKAGDKVKADGLKITINSIFGKLGFEHFWLLDAKQMLSTTVTGQLGLMMLVEDLYLNGIQVISANTDGIVCKIPRELEGKYYEVTKNWEKETSLELEFTQYDKYIRRDVNSYITVKKDGSTKEKGAFLKEVDLKKGYHMPIVAKALSAYYVSGVPIKKTLYDCRDIMEFCISQKSAPSYSIELHTSKGIQPLQKTNRFFITKRGGALFKKDNFSNRRVGFYVGRLVRILNDYDPNLPFEDYQVDLSFYEKEVMKIVDEIEPKQMKMFDFSSLGESHITKADVSNVKSKEKVEKFKVSELNKLGKNQLLKKIESIATNGQLIEKVSPRYVYILDFSSKEMTARIYSLAKGVNQVIGVSKVAYKKQPLEKGKLVYCSKFEKADLGYSIAEYRVTEKIEEEKETLI